MEKGVSLCKTEKQKDNKSHRMLVEILNLKRLSLLHKKMKYQTRKLVKKEKIKGITIDDLTNLFVKYYACVSARAETVVTARNGKGNV